MPIDLQQGPGQDQNTDSLASATLLEAMNFAFVSEKKYAAAFLVASLQLAFGCKLHWLLTAKLHWLLFASLIGFWPQASLAFSC